MLILALSDLHGHLPTLPKLNLDVLVIAGDICPVGTHVRLLEQAHWYRDVFNPWLESLDVKNKIITWGNHDWAPERVPHLMPTISASVLNDSGIGINGINFWGSPWQLRFHDWAFNLDEPEIARKYENIPNNISVLVSHGPPFGYGDKTFLNENVGSPSLTKAIIDKNIKITITGHIHPAFGEYRIPSGQYVFNSSVVDNKYCPVNNGFLIKLNEKGDLVDWQEGFNPLRLM